MRVVVFGAGYAGLTVARRLSRRLPSAVELVVVNEGPSHLVQHELHRLVRHPDLADVVTVPLADLLPDARLEQARVTAIDTERKVATLVRGDGTESELTYDLAAVCLGAETNFYDLPGVEEHAHPLKRVVDAEYIHEAALENPDGNVVVGGAGLSGIQTAGELHALAREKGLDLHITLVEQAARVAPGFRDAFADAVRAELDARDVSVETDAAVEHASTDAVTLADGRTLTADVFVWTGGIRGPAALDGERATVDGTLRVAEGTYVVGDAAAVVDESGRDVPASAQTAVREATVAVANILTATGAESEATDSYEYEEAGWVVSVGDGAVAQVGDVILSGEPARLAKAAIGAGHLGSVGELGKATDLVATELGWPTHADLAGLPNAPVPTDPSTLSSLQSSLGTAAFDLSTALLPGDTYDFTWLTRLADREFPGSVANTVWESAHHGYLDATDESE